MHTVNYCKLPHLPTSELRSLSSALCKLHQFAILFGIAFSGSPAVRQFAYLNAYKVSLYIFWSIVLIQRDSLECQLKTTAKFWTLNQVPTLKDLQQIYSSPTFHPFHAIRSFIIVQKKSHFQSFRIISISSFWISLTEFPTKKSLAKKCWLKTFGNQKSSAALNNNPNGSDRLALTRASYIIKLLKESK